MKAVGMGNHEKIICSTFPGKKSFFFKLQFLLPVHIKQEWKREKGHGEDTARQRSWSGVPPLTVRTSSANLP